jgi:hypothetical protein
MTFVPSARKTLLAVAGFLIAALVAAFGLSLASALDSGSAAVDFTAVIGVVVLAVSAPGGWGVLTHRDALLWGSIGAVSGWAFWLIWRVGDWPAAQREQGCEPRGNQGPPER